MTNYLDELNDSQRDAVLYCSGPELVIAGAGSGKTRVLTYKIAYLLEQGFKPWSILALTFTNKAAREMKSRIARQVGEDKARHLWMGTFHSIFCRILRTEADRVGFSSNFTIYDAADSKSMIKSILKDMGLDEKVYKPAEVQRRISNAKNRLMTADDYVSVPALIKDDQQANMGRIYEIYKIYENRCRVSDAMDFDDLLLQTYLLFKNQTDICNKYAELFEYILVDEYQDTNHAQHCIVMQLTAVHRRICVVGDDAQSIYSFRGANIDNILSFPKFFENTQVFKLEQNYRSTQFIVKAANSLIRKNNRQIPKEVYSMNGEGEPLRVMEASSDTEEGEMVVNRIQQMKREQDYTYDDFAVLYRTNAQSRLLEEVLRKRGIPYIVYGGLSFYQRKEIKDLIAYFRLSVNPNDEEALKRVINYPGRGIGETTLTRIMGYALEHDMSIWEVISTEALSECGLNKGIQGKVSGFVTLLNGFIKLAQTEQATTVAAEIVKDTKIMLEFSPTNPEDMSRRENIAELINGVEVFCEMAKEEGRQSVNMSDYLSEIALLTDMDSTAEADEPKVTLMTVHSAKGLEFKNVFIVGLEENLFPSLMFEESPRALEEERRLFYVAITRAEEHCVLSYARMRYRYGRMEMNRPSRFISDISTELLQGQIAEKSRWETPEAISRISRLADQAPRHAAPSNLRPINVPSDLGTPSEEHQNLVGRRISHDRFGIGQIMKVEGKGGDARATIRFKESGDKQLLLKYARFEIIE